MPGGYDIHYSSDLATQARSVEKVLPIQKFGSIGALNRLFWFKAPAAQAFELVNLLVSPGVIGSGTMKVDLLVNGVSVMGVKPSASVADTPIAGTFVTTRIAAGATVLVRTTSDSNNVTDAHGILILRPLLGSEIL